jgi:hypothetical protein
MTQASKGIDLLTSCCTSTGTRPMTGRPCKYPDTLLLHSPAICCAAPKHCQPVSLQQHPCTHLTGSWDTPSGPGAGPGGSQGVKHPHV